MYSNGHGVPQDYAEAVKWYRKAAEQDDGCALYNLAIMYERGHGVRQDYDEALWYYSKAAEQGYADALFNLGSMFATGRGVQQDYVQAHKWASLSASLSAPGENRDTAIFARDTLATQMTSAQLAKAERWATEWLEKHPKKKK